MEYGHCRPDESDEELSRYRREDVYVMHAAHTGDHELHALRKEFTFA